MFPRENKNNAYAKFQRANKEYYHGIFDGSLWDLHYFDPWNLKLSFDQKIILIKRTGYYLRVTPWPILKETKVWPENIQGIEENKTLGGIFFYQQKVKVIVTQ